MAHLVHTLRIIATAATKLPKAVGAAAELLGTCAARLRTKGVKPAWYYLRYYVNNRIVSFCNCYSNTTRVECPCCGWRGYDFIPMDGVVFWTPRIVCPACLAYDRHRAFSLYVSRRDNRVLQTDGITLHIAPETYVAAIVRKNNAQRYLVSDLETEKLQDANGTAFQADMQRMPLPDNCVDTVICFHVLEHIAEDRRAVSELVRMLKPGGVAYIMVPINTALEKSHYFGSPNADIFGHYWAPGRDYMEHLDAFDIREAVKPTDYMSADEAFRFGVMPKEVIFVCSKR